MISLKAALKDEATGMEGARRATGIPVARNISPDPEVKRMPKEDG